MSEILAFCERHPITAVLVIYIVCCTVAEVVGHICQRN